MAKAKTTAKRKATAKSKSTAKRKTVTREKATAKNSATAKKQTSAKKKTTATKTTAKSTKKTTKKSKSSAKATAKTVQTPVSPKTFIKSVDNETRKQDAAFLLTWFTDLTGLKPVMWGPSIIGYGRYYYKYDSGHEGESLITGFSPRKGSLVFYIMPGYRDLSEPLSRLGKHKLGRACLYINKLSDINLEVLAEIVKAGVAYMQKNYKTWDK
jgi:hypothetical protein